MDYHKNAPWTAISRERLARMVVHDGQTVRAAAARFSISARTAAKWVGRYRLLGPSGLADRSSRPHRSPRQTSSFLVEKVLALRRGHMPGYEIARRTGLSPASVSRIQMLPDQKAETTIGFLNSAVAFFASHGIGVRALLTDNGSSYRSQQFRHACQQMAIKHRRTRPYTPRTNGKAERFIQTALREWVYAKYWTNSQERDMHLQPWNDYYNRERPHGSLNYKPPISRSDSGTTS